MCKISRIYIFTLLASLLCCITTANAAQYPRINERYIDSLDRYLRQSDKYVENAISRLEERRTSILAKPESEQLSMLADLAEDYSRLSVDTAISLYQRGLDMARRLDDKHLEAVYMYRMSRFLPIKGMPYEGIEMYNKADVSKLTPKDMFDYYRTGKRLYFAVAYTYDIDSISKRYRDKALAYVDSTCAYLTSNDLEKHYYSALAMTGTPEESIAIAELNDVLSRASFTDPLFSNAALALSNIADRRGNVSDSRYYNALSAMSELAAGSRHTQALNNLGKILYHENDHRRAFEFMVYALESALQSGAHIRAVEVSDVLPMVIRTERRLEAKRTNTLYIILSVLIIALIVFGALLYYAYRTRKKLRTVREELARMNNSKDLYIRKLISLCGVYLAALENFNKLAGRKIKVGQINDLLDMIESGKIIREQLQKFYEVFDEAFLMVYPDFVPRVNSLLQPDRQLALGEDGHLGTELRILAFMRLGMDDSTQIAKFLRLSLNTVYTYRNKVKSRALDRDNFEKNILNIRQTI